MERYKKNMFMGIVFIALGITFSTTLNSYSSLFGTVLIAVGGLFFIIAMNEKKKFDGKEYNNY